MPSGLHESWELVRNSLIETISRIWWTIFIHKPQREDWIEMIVHLYTRLQVQWHQAWRSNDLLSFGQC
jgi:hypothetical protein